MSVNGFCLEVEAQVRMGDPCIGNKQTSDAIMHLCEKQDLASARARNYHAHPGESVADYIN